MKWLRHWVELYCRSSRSTAPTQNGAQTISVGGIQGMAPGENGKKYQSHGGHRELDHKEKGLLWNLPRP